MKNISCFVLFFLISVSLASAAETRIFNGYNSDSRSWMVSIGHRNKPGIKGHFCGGVVIESQWVLTAAHCVKSYFSRPYLLDIRYGSESLDDAVQVAVDGIIIHKDYDEISNSHDMALVHLSRPVNLPAIDVYQGSFENLPGVISKVYGWGLTQFSQLENRPVNYLQTVDIHVRSHEECRQGLKNSYDNYTMLCAGELSSSDRLQDGKDSCYGDSGGPLTVNIDGREQLIGLVSWGMDCASSKSYGVYTNIPNLKDWLKVPRVIPSYAINSPKVSGVPAVGQKLHCKKPKVVNHSGYRLKYRWLDYESGKVFSRSSKLKLSNALESHKLICEVKVVSAAAETYAYSKSTPKVRRLSSRR